MKQARYQAILGMLAGSLYPETDGKVFDYCREPCHGAETMAQAETMAGDFVKVAQGFNDCTIILRRVEDWGYQS